jgi:hypothetical protein
MSEDISTGWDVLDSAFSALRSVVLGVGPQDWGRPTPMLQEAGRACDREISHLGGRPATRKLIESILLSLDGVTEAPERWASFDAEAPGNRHRGTFGPATENQHPA